MSVLVGVVGGVANLGFKGPGFKLQREIKRNNEKHLNLQQLFFSS